MTFECRTCHQDLPEESYYVINGCRLHQCKECGKAAKRKKWNTCTYKVWSTGTECGRKCKGVYCFRHTYVDKCLRLRRERRGMLN